MLTKPYGTTGIDATVIGFGAMRFPQPKDTEAILVKTHSRDMTFSFERTFEQEQWYADILKGTCSFNSE